MNSSALCEWPHFREWTQIKVNHQSCHGDTQSAHLGLCSKPRTTHFITTSLFQLNEVLMSCHTLKKLGSIWQDLNIHSTSIHNHISCVGLLIDDRKKCPPPPGPHELGEEKNNKPQDFPDGPMDKNWPPSAADMGSFSGLEDSTCCRATKPVSHNYWAQALEPVHYCNYWSLCTWSLCSATGETTSEEAKNINEKAAPAHHN